jgi:hypothetical protein
VSATLDKSPIFATSAAPLQCLRFRCLLRYAESIFPGANISKACRKGETASPQPQRSGLVARQIRHQSAKPLEQQPLPRHVDSYALVSHRHKAFMSFLPARCMEAPSGSMRGKKAAKIDKACEASVPVRRGRARPFQNPPCHCQEAGEASARLRTL